ncbi:hybrid sensor histidine kinase/response regulator transcription factor [Flavobacterium lindanitolerans]|uniref:histidine kinase n=1 Tax=Flavobacterium lindanitolerans TaxID=428988 RepID=A0A497UZG7_9FLAO|nr:ATP-binding protein [Flavobacterium lindanitolerans]PKW29201.1 signal transduction histidine kinase [Flavobacterium lindanitolerans]RLJ35297.1 signal transduction histidine kinase [Flavobacterium lindanitolerans]
MAKFAFYFIIVFSIVFPQQMKSQNTADSLHTLIKKADGLRKSELNLELAKYFLPTNQDSCLYYSQVAQKIGKKINNHAIVIRSFALIAESYQKQNKMKEAIATYQEGLKLAEKHNEKSLAGNIYNGIGTCYFAMNDLKKAEYYLQQAAQAKKEANDYHYYSFIAANLAALQIINQSFGEAIHTLKDAEKILLKNKQEKYLSTVYNSLGAAYQGTKSDSCVYYFEKGLEISQKNKDYLNMMTTYQNLGDYYMDKKNNAKAVEYMKRAIAVNDLRPEDQYKPALYERIGILYESMGDFKNAYHYKKLENETRQRLFSVAKQKEIEELEIKYQSEKKEKAIQLHKHEAEKAKNQQTALLYGSALLFLIGGFITYLIFQRRKITQKFEKEKLRMFENILHEIKTPLTLIDGPIQVMKQRSDSSNEEQLSLMERNSKKLMSLVTELLDASKLGRGSFQLHYTNGAVDDFIENTIDTFANEAKSKDIQITHAKNNVEKHYSLPSNALEKILSNLIGNAVKYCPPKAKIQVASQIEGGRLNIRVSDTGPGIPKGEQKKVFRRFFRGNQTSDTNGTGIGLSLVKELVELAQGTIHLQSDSSGTTFLVSLPIQEAVNHTDAGIANESMPILLLAEDDADTAAFSIAVLKENFQIIHAKNGQEALDLIRKNLPDIVLSDVMMPEKDGIELLSTIRSEELTNHLPFVLFSAKASLESRLEGLQHGADAYISKPFSPDELKLTIKNLFNTVQRNKEAYKEAIHSEKVFEERVKSPNSYVNKVIGHILDNIDNQNYSVNELSDNMSVSRSQLHRKLVALTGFSTTNFISMIRLEKAKDLLLNNEGNITEIAYKCGFNSQSYFTKSFTEYFGKSPSQVLKNQ